MNARLTLSPALTLAALALCGSIAFAQQPAPAAPSNTPAPAAAPAAPIERHRPANAGMRPGMRGGMRPGMQGRPGGPGAANFRSHGNFRGGGGGNFREGAASGFRFGPEGTWWKNPNVAQRLALTPDQVKRMDGIFQQSRLQLIDLKANLEKQQVMLEPMLGANPLDTAKATIQIDKVADARAELEKANAKMLLGIRAVLTPDQWTKISDHRFGGPGAAAADGQPAPAQNGGPGGGPGRGRGMHGGGPGGPADINGVNMDDTRP